MTRKLIIDGHDYGTIEQYKRTDGFKKQWHFISVDEHGGKHYNSISVWDIRLWDSAGGPKHRDFDISTFTGYYTTITHPERKGTYKYSIASKFPGWVVKRERLSTEKGKKGCVRYSQMHFDTLPEAYHAIQMMRDHPLKF